MTKTRLVITNSIICATLLVLAFFVFNLNTSQTYLTTTAPLYNGNRNTKQVALMFIVDDNETVHNLPVIMQALTTAKAKATFFFTGTTVLNNLATVKEIGEKFELGNYGFSNCHLNLADKDKITNEIKFCDELIASVANYHMNLFTPPDCIYNKNTLGIADSLGYRTILPTVRKVSIDWQNTDTNLVVSYATYDTQPGDIILLRPVKATMQSMSRILATFMQRDLTVTAVGELLQQQA